MAEWEELETTGKWEADYAGDGLHLLEQLKTQLDRHNLKSRKLPMPRSRDYRPTSINDLVSTKAFIEKTKELVAIGRKGAAIDLLRREADHLDSILTYEHDIASPKIGNFDRKQWASLWASFAMRLVATCKELAILGESRAASAYRHLEDAVAFLGLQDGTTQQALALMAELRGSVEFNHVTLEANASPGATESKGA
jgi:hypothetical protein